MSGRALVFTRLTALSMANNVSSSRYLKTTTILVNGVTAKRARKTSSFTVKQANNYDTYIHSKE